MKKIEAILRPAGIVACTAILLAALPLWTNAAQQPEFFLSKLTIQSRILDEERTISVALPEGYKDGDSHYPVLYMLDAEAQVRFVRDCSTVHKLSSEGVLPPMIVIGIWNPEGKRNRDMIPQGVAHRPGSGGSKQFLRFIREELAPHVKKEYRASDMAILYGGSNAGLFVVYAMLEDPEVFDAGVAGSPMIGHCPEFMRELAASFVKRVLSERRTLFMIYGSKDNARVTDFVPDYQEFLKQNAPADFAPHLVILEGEGHVPPSSLERGLRTIFLD
jgi:predicted alpha/beta superfamily hydrolase